MKKPEAQISQRLETVLRYHHATKHQPDRYARSLGYLDWPKQPRPFRFYEGAECVELPLMEEDQALPHEALYRRRTGPSVPLTLENISTFLALGLGLSAWKKQGQSEWVLRMNPSSGNLHPTECYLILPPLDDQPCLTVHYNPYMHCLEVLSLSSGATGHGFAQVPHMGLILTSIYWRESWKYGERAFRYCNHDVGHALAALCFSANLLGWHLSMQPQIGDKDLDALLGLDAADRVKGEEEHADCLCWVSTGEMDASNIEAFLVQCRSKGHAGKPNRLSSGHTRWDIIEEVSAATRSSGQEQTGPSRHGASRKHGRGSPLSAQAIIRSRRSAQSFDRERSFVEREAFLSILGKTLPGGGVPFDCLSQPPRCHLALFVHHVVSLEPGLYLFVRNPEHDGELRSLLDKGFAWSLVEGGFPLYLLQTGAFRQKAEMVSCHQEIAGESAFSLGMVCRFKPVIKERPSVYPRLFWETGMIGQILYLEAEAHGLRGTGIGCFFDDMMHDILGIKGDLYQSLYHFTVGYPLEDRRIQTMAPYSHLSKA